MPFAAQNFQLDYWQKQTKPLFADLFWNIPEQKTGRVNIIGGNSQNFHSIVRLAENLSAKFPLREVRLLLPDSLRGKIPTFPNIDYAISTTSGSFDKSIQLKSSLISSDFVILGGDFSKNSATAVALTEAITTSFSQNPENIPPLLVTRDTVDLLAPSSAQIIQHPRLFLLASLAQLQKVFRALYYPRMIMLSQPLIPTLETLHKFTLSYNKITLITFHESQIIVANSGKIITTPVANTDFTPLSLFTGTLAATIAALNLYNPNKPLAASAAALLPPKSSSRAGFFD